MCESVDVVEVVSYFVLDAFGSDVPRSAAWAISGCAVSGLRVVSSQSSAGRFVEFNVSRVCHLFCPVRVASNAL